MPTPAAPPEGVVFASAKRTILHKLRAAVDLSPKGSIDAPLVTFLSRLNARAEFVSTSSCSGRIALYAWGGGGAGAEAAEEVMTVEATAVEAEAAAEEVATAAGETRRGSSKGGGSWLLVTHEGGLTAAAIAAALALAPPGSSAVLKVEPLILHVQCRDTDAARALLLVAAAAGFRESGMTLGGAGGAKVIVAVRSTAGGLEVPLREGGRDIAPAAYLQELAGIADARFRDVCERRARFLRAFDAAFGASQVVLLDPAAQSPAAVSQPSLSSGGACSSCGARFATRNLLFRHLQVPEGGVTPGDGAALSSARLCPAVPPASAQRTSPAPLAATRFPGPREPSCNGCGALFASRNLLFRHVGSCAPSRALALPLPAGWQTVQRLSPAGALLLEPSMPLGDADICAAREATATAGRALARLYLARGAATAARCDVGPSPFSFEWAPLSPVGSVGERLARWGHTATLLHPAAASAGAGASGAVVAVVGGYSCAGVHGRCADVLLFDTLSRAWVVPALVPGSDAPPPMTRHAAIAVPWAGARAATAPPVANEGSQPYDALLVLGGHNGPLRPASCAWWLVVAGDGAGSFTATWREARLAEGPAPPPRWGAAAAFIPPSHGAPAGGIVMFGGRDAHDSYGDVWAASFAHHENDGLPYLRWGQVRASGSVWQPRFYHAAAPLHPGFSAGSESADLVCLVSHGGYCGPYADHMAGATTSGDVSALLGDVAVLRMGWSRADEAYTATWCPVSPSPVGAPLEPRCSHSLVALPRGSLSSDGARVAGASQLVLLGGECEEPRASASARLLSLRFDGAAFSYGVEAAMGADVKEQGGGPAVPSVSGLHGGEDGVAESQSHPPLLLRAAVVLLPPAASVASASPGAELAHTLLSVGGGAVCFAFGSHASQPYVCVVRLASLPPAAGLVCAPPASLLASPASPAPSAVTHALLVHPRDAQWVGDAAEAAGWRDLAFRSGPVAATADAAGLPAGLLAGSVLATTPSPVIGIPITSAAVAAIAAGQLLQESRLTASLARGSIAVRSARLPLHSTARHDPLTGGPASLARLAHALAGFLRARAGDVASSLDAELLGLLEPGAPGGMPRRVERLGDDLLLMPRGALTHRVWGSPPSHLGANPATPSIWDVVCEVLRATRLARREEIVAGPTRASRVVLLRGGGSVAGAYALPPLSDAPATRSILDEPVPALRELSARRARPPPAGDVEDGAEVPPLRAQYVDVTSGGWVCVREGGVLYAFDVTRTMFSSGNVSEKARVAALPAAGETVVDMFCGIGYWTLPLLLRAGAAHVHACDWNPDAVRTLRINLAANRIRPSAVTLWPGDNAQLRGSVVEGTADRVLLGLLPCSRAAWPTALRCLKASGGTLHVHANVADSELSDWTAALPATLADLARSAGRRWGVVVEHVERVKSYAPHVWHVVADVRCAVEA